MTELPDRRMADEDRREQPGAGYGKAMSLDPSNGRIEQRRSWKKNRGRFSKLSDPLTPDAEAELGEFLQGFNREGS